MPTLPVNFEMPYDNFQIVVRIRIIKDVHILEGTFEHIKKSFECLDRGGGQKSRFS